MEKHVPNMEYRIQSTSQHGQNPSQIEPCQPGQPQNSTQMNDSNPQVFTIEYLMSLKRDDLVEICKQHNIRTTGKKLILANRIIAICNPSKEDAEIQNKVLSQLDAHKQQALPPHHNFYKDHFNGVDLANGRWYDWNLKLHIRHWRCPGNLLFSTGVVGGLTTCSFPGKQPVFRKYVGLCPKFLRKPSISLL